MTADRDESEEPLRLFAIEQIRHEGPEKRHDKEIEDADPDVESAPDPDVLLRGQGAHEEVKDDQVRDEKAVGDRKKFPARHLCHDGGEGGVGEQGDDERAGEEPRQILHPAGRGDVVPDRPDDVVAAEDDEIKEPGEAERADLVRPDVDRPTEEGEE